ncbi:caspase family protein [Leptolyngbya cf. ectocarpi LEGE 11479]|uniref:Caspase family protein n=1 Tax=Leptolyngbya cf. ectocarpi LEGE 11479 TaxID=1828722 RepID=A0A928ZXF8_LEPEC|nr:caspase family protein [Leptolyngbya ectocarpi]MBE9069180.1 caspase family protein [Leptolyngbya cf. ectocarpi LEGE 11479]
MAPMSLKTSRASRILETGKAKLWAILIGIDNYVDDQLPDLAYSAADCQGVADALAVATQSFPRKTLIVHHDTANNLPTLSAVRANLDRIINDAAEQDTVLIYFSGHGSLTATDQQIFLCFQDTDRTNLRETGLSMQELLTILSHCAARHQLVWLDACHSGGLSLKGASRNNKVLLDTYQSDDLPLQGSRRDNSIILENPTVQLMDLLRQKAKKSQGFYALLSCGQAQQSWEFSELGHGVFSHYLIQGLLGAAADEKGVIEADKLYKYVYYQTLRYIDETNRKIRLNNQQKRGQGSSKLFSEYPWQTPKRIVEGVGELVLGLRSNNLAMGANRPALIIDGFADSTSSLDFGKQLQKVGGFDVTYCPQVAQVWSEIPQIIENQFQVNTLIGYSTSATGLLYLRGQILTEGTNTALLLRGQQSLAQSWLRRTLRRSHVLQQIVILDCPGANDLQDWISDLQVDDQHGQCLIAGSSPLSNPDAFIQILLETLSTEDPESAFSAASWVTKLQKKLSGTEIQFYSWLSHYRGVIEILPGARDSYAEKPNLDLGLCPYVGLNAFTEDDARFFFGRDHLTQQLIEGISHQAFLAVVGASGSGKSSVVQAGLMARLRQGHDIPNSENWQLYSCRPGNRPLTALAQCLVEPGTSREQQYQQQQQLEGILYQGAEGVVYWLRSQPQPVTVLVVDQFEELFTLAPLEDRKQFLALLFEILEQAADRFKLVITLRADFIASCLEYPQLTQALQRNRVLVPPVLQSTNYQQVIVNPAEAVGLEVEPELVDSLLQDLSQGLGDLPLLEFVLTQVWEQRQPGLLTLQTYQQQVGGLKGALERKAQSIYDGFDEQAQACVRWIFLSLTQLGDGTEDTRRRIGKQALMVSKYPVELVEKTLQVLVKEKLVVVSSDSLANREDSPEGSGEATMGIKGGQTLLESQIVESSYWNDIQTDLEELKAETTVEVAHEILIRHWSTLRWWLDENRDRLRAQRQLEDAAQQWIQNQAKPEYLLSGIRLEAAEDLYIHYTDELSAEAQQFFEACQEAREEARQQDKRKLRRTRITLGIVTALGLGTLALSGVAWRQSQRAIGSNIKALNTLAESQFSEHKSLESAISSVQAGRQLERLRPWVVGPQTYTDLRVQTIATLMQVIPQNYERNRWTDHAQEIHSARYSPDGQWIASASGKEVFLRKSDGTSPQTLFGSSDNQYITDIAFSPDSQKLAIATGSGGRVWFSNLMADDDNKLTWKISKEESHSLLVAHDVDGNIQVAFSPDGEYLATASDKDQVIKLWDAQTYNHVGIFEGHSTGVKALTFSHDGQQLASVDVDNVIRNWQVEDQKLVGTQGKSGLINDIVFSLDKNQLFFANGYSIYIWNLSENDIIEFEEFESWIEEIAISPNGAFLLSGGTDPSHIQITRVANKKILANLSNYASSPFSIDFFPEQSPSDLFQHGVIHQKINFLSAGDDETIRQWEALLLLEPDDSFVEFPSMFGYSPELNIYATGEEEGAVFLSEQNIHDAEVASMTMPSGHVSNISAIDFSPNSKLIASSNKDEAYTIQLWDVVKKEPRGSDISQQFQGHQERINSLDFNPSTTKLASGSKDLTIRLWNLDGQLLKILEGHQESVRVVKFSPDGQLIASGSSDGSIRLWNLEGECLEVLSAHTGDVTDIAFSPNGKWMVSASKDQTVNLWRIRGNTLDSEPLKTLTEHSGNVRDVEFTYDSQTIMSRDNEGTIMLWNLNSTSPIKTVTRDDPPSNLQFIFRDETGINFANPYPLMAALNDPSALANWLSKGCNQLSSFLFTLNETDERSQVCPRE